ncbi:MAG: hypothetical protein HY762_04575 [Planctomycetes bacterium]|nr:hypothetical protein [Planctomycetota bacterium]
MSVKHTVFLQVFVLLMGGCYTQMQPDKPKMPELWLDAKGVHQDYTAMNPPVGLNLTAAIPLLRDAETIDKIKQSLEQFAGLLWADTFGQLYIKQVILRNNSQDGYIHFEKLEKLGGHARFGGPFTVNTNLLDLDQKTGRKGVGVKVLAAGIMHEFGHSMLLLKDEYGTTRECIMHPQSRTSHFCESCEKELLDRFKNWKFPVGDERAKWVNQNKVPEPTITMGKY